MYNKPIIVKIVIFIALLASGNACTQSFYSVYGFGVTNYFVNAKSVGMGGAGLATYEDLTQAFLNPASLSALTSTYISGNLVHEVSNLTSNAQKATITNTDFQGVQFSFPFKAQSAALSLGIMPYSFIGYSAIGEGEKDNNTYTESVAGSGGLNSGFVSLSVAPFRMLTVGFSGLYYFGQLRNRWEVDFRDNDLTDTRDELSYGVTGADYRLGAIIRLTPRIAIGGIYSPAQELKANKRIQLVNRLELSDYPDENVTIPEVIGVGTFLQVSRKLQFALDYYSEKWAKAGLANQGYVNDSQRIGAGFDFMPARAVRQPYGLSFWSRTAYRLGFYYRNLGLEAPAGQSVTEMFATIGLGMPIKWALARLDFSLEVGKRGSKNSNPFEETVVRFTGSITVGERWFQRRRR